MERASDPTPSRYISEALAVPQLTREDEYRMARAFRDSGDETARDALVRAHLRAVISIARKYHRYGLPLSELIAEGNFGLVTALSRFEPERGHRFVTYAAFWIRAYILNYILRSWSVVSAGSAALRSKMFFKLKRERSRIVNLVGEGEEAEQMLAKELGVTRGALSAMLGQLDGRDVSLDVKPFDDSRASLLDGLASCEIDQEACFAAAEIRGHVRDAVRVALADLNSRERYIVEHRLMADGGDELSLAELGRRLGVSRERVRQLEKRAKEKLKSRISELSRTAGAEWLLESAA